MQNKYRQELIDSMSEDDQKAIFSSDSTKAADHKKKHFEIYTPVTEEGLKLIHSDIIEMQDKYVDKGKDIDAYKESKSLLDSSKEAFLSEIDNLQKDWNRTESTYELEAQKNKGLVKGKIPALFETVLNYYPKGHPLDFYGKLPQKMKKARRALSNLDYFEEMKRLNKEIKKKKTRKNIDSNKIKSLTMKYYEGSSVLPKGLLPEFQNDEEMKSLYNAPD